MPAEHTEAAAEDVTVYLAGGRTERHEGVSRERACELEMTLGSSPNIMRIDVDPAGHGDAGEWRPGECDRCYGEVVNGAPVPVHCACLIGQGASEADCVCGPAALVVAA
ncbi:MAG TPA: hypothetical protein VGS97_14045 [Actinocrinis sp.]|uniref:hypothetical protein n=1 Tax=Actinocrinis sp. TaxID=1920516 RepID=UPI002DDDAB11|nr:hypothetical protein [Actinocrinis sp.]HEV2345215.1 hypothetical protein [Actinocrinis sp.]